MKILASKCSSGLEYSVSLGHPPAALFARFSLSGGDGKRYCVGSTSHFLLTHCPDAALICNRIPKIMLGSERVSVRFLKAVSNNGMEAWNHGIPSDQMV